MVDMDEEHKRIRTILVLGAPGSGKGTQGGIMGAIPGFFHLACGDVFRSLDTTSELGSTFLQYSSQGKLVPDQFTIQLWLDHIQGREQTGDFRPDEEILVLDGSGVAERGTHRELVARNGIYADMFRRQHMAEELGEL